MNTRIKIQEQPNAEAIFFEDFAGNEFGNLRKVARRVRCGACNGPTMKMGTLGNRVHYRCTNCGTEQS